MRLSWTPKPISRSPLTDQWHWKYHNVLRYRFHRCNIIWYIKIWNYCSRQSFFGSHGFRPSNPDTLLNHWIGLWWGIVIIPFCRTVHPPIINVILNYLLVYIDIFVCLRCDIRRFPDTLVAKLTFVPSSHLIGQLLLMNQNHPLALLWLVRVRIRLVVGHMVCLFCSLLRTRRASTTAVTAVSTRCRHCQSTMT